MAVGVLWLLGGRHAAYLVLYQIALTVVFIGTCAWKGETSRWRGK